MIKWYKSESPLNNVKCIIECTDGAYAIAMQCFGEWRDCLKRNWGYNPDEVVRWCYFTEEDWEITGKFLKTKAGEGA